MARALAKELDAAFCTPVCNTGKEVYSGLAAGQLERQHGVQACASPLHQCQGTAVQDMLKRLNVRKVMF
jgi:hypothetical protein